MLTTSKHQTPGYEILISPIVAGALVGGIKNVLREVRRVFSEMLEIKISNNKDYS